VAAGLGVAGYLAPETTFGQTVEALPPQRDTSRHQALTIRPARAMHTTLDFYRRAAA
jgi:hypothetical protein